MLRKQFRGIVKTTIIIENYYFNKTTKTETTDKISAAPVPVTTQDRQTVMPKSMVLDPEWFDRDKMKFEDQWREIQLFLKSNRVIRTDNRITAILA